MTIVLVAPPPPQQDSSQSRTIEQHKMSIFGSINTTYVDLRDHDWCTLFTVPVSNLLEHFPSTEFYIIKNRMVSVLCKWGSGYEYSLNRILMSHSLKGNNESETCQKYLFSKSSSHVWNVSWCIISLNLTNNSTCFHSLISPPPHPPSRIPHPPQTDHWHVFISYLWEKEMSRAPLNVQDQHFI